MGYAFELIQNFLDAGGQVLWVIMFTTLALWVLIIERFAFFKTEVPKIKKATEEKWKGTGSHMSWEAHRIREMILSQAKSEVFKFIARV